MAALLFRLPLMLLELLLRRLFGRDEDDTVAVVTDERAPAAAAAAPPPPATAFPGATRTNGAPPTADEAIERRRAREAAGEPVSSTPLRPIGDSGHIDSESAVVESFGPADDVGDVGGTITVDEPWPGYDEDNASAIVQRLRSSDEATKAVVALYERGHKNRATVLRAAG